MIDFAFIWMKDPVRCKYAYVGANQTKRTTNIQSRNEATWDTSSA